MSAHRAPNDSLVVCPSIESTDTPENDTLFQVDETESTATSHRNVRQTEKNSDPTRPDRLAPEDVNKSQDSSVWRRAWITPASIVGFYTAGVLFNEVDRIFTELLYSSYVCSSTFLRVQLPRWSHC